jgi:hypothetical protein
MHLRYAELVISYLAFAMAKSLGIVPERFVKSGWPLVFGFVRHQATNLAGQVSDGQSDQPWHRFFAKIIVSGNSSGVIQWLNDERNAVAHGRVCHGVEEIRDRLISFLQVSEWRRITQEIEPPQYPQLFPWLVTHPDIVPDDKNDGQNVGIFEQWSPGVRKYVIPWSGVPFADTALKDGGTG